MTDGELAIELAEGRMFDAKVECVMSGCSAALFAIIVLFASWRDHESNRFHAGGFWFAALVVAGFLGFSIHRYIRFRRIRRSLDVAIVQEVQES